MKKALLIIGGIAVVGTIGFFGIRYYNMKTAVYSLNVTVSDWNSKTAQYQVLRNGKVEASGIATMASGGSGTTSGQYQLEIIKERDSLGFFLKVNGKQIDMRVVNFAQRTIENHGG